MKEMEPTVFVVDDDESVRVALNRLIRSMGMNVETFATGQEFLSRKRHDGPGCLVLDVRMPGLSGLDLLQELEVAEILLPVVFITGHGTVPLSVRAMKAGAVDFLEKPFEDQALLDSIRKAIERGSQDREKYDERKQIQMRSESLTPREREIFAHVASGKLNKQIAFELGISEKTVKIHRSRVMEKMEAESLADLVRMAERSPPRKNSPV